MKHFKLTFIVFGLLLFGCNQTNSKNTATTNKKSVDTTEKQIKQEKFDNNDKLDDYKIDSIKNVIVLFKEKNIDKISNKISFPLYREYPIPPIKDKEEFRQRFSCKLPQKQYVLKVDNFSNFKNVKHEKEHIQSCPDSRHFKRI